VFNAEHRDQARERLTHVLARLEPVAPKVCRLLEDAEEDLIAFYAFPSEHWTKLLTDTLDGDGGAIEDGDRGCERPNDQRGAGGVGNGGDEGGRAGGLVVVRRALRPLRFRW
jgi:hypothetical protein